MKLEYRINNDVTEIIWNGRVVGIVNDPEAATKLAETLWLHEHLKEITHQSLVMLTDIMKVMSGPRNETEKRFMIEANFMLGLLQRERAEKQVSQPGGV